MGSHGAAVITLLSRAGNGGGQGGHMGDRKDPANVYRWDQVH
jgi:hypothetical protein